MSVMDSSTRKLKRMATRQLKRVWRYEWHGDRTHSTAIWLQEFRDRSRRLDEIRAELKRRGESA